MPEYCFITKDQKPVSLFMTVAEVSRLPRNGDLWKLPDGRWARRDFAAEHCGAETTWTKPILSDAAGVHPSQIPEFKAHAAAHGVNIDFHPDGRAIFNSRSQRMKYLKCVGLHDKNAFSRG